MRIILLLAFLLAALHSQAQILNVEKNRTSRDTTYYWVGDLNFTLLLHNRSASPENPLRFTALGTGADVAYVSGHHRFMLLNQLSYSAVTGNAFISTGYSHFRANFLWQRPLSYELFAQAQYDIGRGLKSRYLSGGGIRYTFVKEEKINLAVGMGAMYEQERWQVPGAEDAAIVKTRFLKGSQYLSGRWQVNAFVNMNAIVYYQAGYDRALGGLRNRFSADANLNVRLGSRLTFFTAFNGAYDNQPVVPVVNFIYSLNNGLKVSL